MGLMFGTMAIGAALTMVRHGLTWEHASQTVSTEPLTLGVAQLVGLGVALIVGAARAYPEAPVREAVSLQPTTLRALALATIAGLCLQFSLAELGNVVSQLVPAIATTEQEEASIAAATRIDGPLRAITVTFAFVVVAPVTEELLFRGLLLSALRARLGTAGALFFTSVLFGLFHLVPLAVIYASIAGLLLGWVFLRTGSIAPGIAMHAANNAVGVLLPAELVPIPGLSVEGDHIPLPLVIATTIGVVVSLALLPARSET